MNNKNSKSIAKFTTLGSLLCSVFILSQTAVAQNANQEWSDYLDFQFTAKGSVNPLVTRYGHKFMAQAEVPVGESLFFTRLSSSLEEAQLHTELTSEALRECADSPDLTQFSCDPTRDIEVSSLEEIELEELGYKYNISDSFEATVGLFAQPWGQFQLISPINFLLPQDFEISTIGLSKESLQLSQEQIALKVFLTERTELQLMHTFSFNLASAIVHAAARDNDIRYSEAFDYLTQDKNLTAIRLMNYQDWGTWGLTYFDGYRQFISKPYAIINAGCNTGSTDCDPENPTFATQGIDPSDPHFKLGNIFPLKAIGLEMNVDLGKNWSFIFEGTFAESQDTLKVHEIYNPNAENGTDKAFINLFQHLSDRPSHNILELQRTFIATGFEKLNLDTYGWSFSFQLLALKEQYEDLDWQELLVLYSDLGRESPGEQVVIPAFYFLNQHNVGGYHSYVVMATGFFGNYYGAVALWDINFTNYLTLEVGLEYLENRQDSRDVRNAANNDNNYKFVGGSELGLSMGVSVHF